MGVLSFILVPFLGDTIDQGRASGAGPSFFVFNAVAPQLASLRLQVRCGTELGADRQPLRSAQPKEAERCRYSRKEIQGDTEGIRFFECVVRVT